MATWDLMKNVPFFCAASVLIISAANLLCQVADVRPWQMEPGMPMKFNTALCLGFISLALMIGTTTAITNLWAKLARILGAGLAAGAIVLSGITIAEFLFDMHWAIDQIFFKDTWASAASHHPGRMAPNAALDFFMLGMICLSLNLRPRKFRLLVEIFSVAVVVTAGAAVIGHIYREMILYRIGPFVSMSLYTAVSLVLLAIGALWAFPDYGLAKVFGSRTSAGQAARRLLVSAVILPILLGRIILEGLLAGHYSGSAALTLLAASTVAIFVGLIWNSTATLERTQAQVLRHESEKVKSLALVDSLFASAPLGLVFFDTELRYQKINEALAKINGAPVDDHIGRTLHEMVPTLADRLESLFRQVLVTGEGVRSSVLESPNTGEDKRQWINTIFPIRTPDKNVIGVGCAVTDISEQKKIELELLQARDTAEAAAKAKSTFIANVSHEIRTPLSSILGFSDLLRKAATDPNLIAHYASIIRRNGEQLTRLVDDLLDLAKIEAGKIVVEPGELVMTELIHNMEELLAPLALKKNLFFSIECDDLVPPVLRTDPARLQQIITNVVGNALKFTEKGHVLVSVTYSETAKQLLFTVRDSGSGIEQEQGQRLFEPFTQLDSSMRRSVGGTGLGLALSKRIAQALGGDLWLQSSKIDEGSAFMFAVGVTRVAKKTPMPVNAESQLIGAASERRSLARRSLRDVAVLLVDDVTDNQILFTDILRDEGACVELAVNGREAIDKALSGKHDIVLMDLHMPLVDGYTAVARLREAGYTTPIVALTANAMPGERERCIEIGCNEFVSKPVHLEKLTGAMLTVLAESSTSRAAIHFDLGD